MIYFLYFINFINNFINNVILQNIVLIYIDWISSVIKMYQRYIGPLSLFFFCIMYLYNVKD